MVGLIVGILGLLAGGYSAMAVSKVKSQMADNQPRIDKIDDIAAQAAAASSAASTTKSQLDGMVKSTQDAFDQVGGQIGVLKQAIQQIQDAQKRAPAIGGRHHGGGGGEVVAGPGEYIVRPGDSGRRIARANGCTVHELMAVNPGVNWSRLHPGQKLHLPQAKDATPPPAPPSS